MEYNWISDLLKEKWLKVGDNVPGLAWMGNNYNYEAVSKEVSIGISKAGISLSIRDGGGEHGIKLTWKQWDEIVSWVQSNREAIC